MAKFAEALGADVFDIYSPDQMREVFPITMKNAEANNKPQVIVAHINSDEVPPYYSVSQS